MLSVLVFESLCFLFRGVPNDHDRTYCCSPVLQLKLLLSYMNPTYLLWSFGIVMDQRGRQARVGGREERWLPKALVIKATGQVKACNIWRLLVITLSDQRVVEIPSEIRMECVGSSLEPGMVDRTDTGRQKAVHTERLWCSSFFPYYHSDTSFSSSDIPVAVIIVLSMYLHIWPLCFKPRVWFCLEVSAL